MRRLSYLLGGLVLLSSLALPVSARAQSGLQPSIDSARPGRPYRGLFGGGVDEPSQLLTASGSISAAADNNVVGALRGPGTSLSSVAAAAKPVGGVFGSGAGSVDYLLSRDNLTINAFGTTTGSYVTQLEPSRLVSSEGGGANVQVHALGDTNFTAVGSVTRRPYFVFELVPLVDATTVPTSYLTDDLAISTEPVLLESGNVGVDHGVHFSQRTAAHLDYAYGRTRIASRAYEYQYQRFGGTLTHSLSQAFAVRAGYHARAYRYPSESQRQTALLHDLDAGVDYSRALGPTHRTMFSATSGATAVTGQGRTVYRIVGDASLLREIGRTWHAGIAYSRSVGFVYTFQAPVLYDSAIADLSGLLTRRLEFTLAARAARGEVGITSGRKYSAYVGTAGVTQALSRNFSLAVSYFYAQYAFDAGIVLPEGVVRQPQRQGVRVTLTAWAPLLYRRKKDASR